ncbi:hypothetical protein ACN42_g10367 [Penicillium freii]|uniref:Glucose-methanol-choline oxidoreductase N-terminal domain-containing protein n=1 Tax=Penicillium freii TaxID=48697 RepID=A0A101MA92_PENFR|nr:hypothetical protein ACN42_g10367 [Penicillium freii]
MKVDNQGCDGPVPVSLPDVYGLFDKAWNETIAQLGWETEADPLDGHKLGAFTSPLSVDVKTGRRGYAAAYYSPEVAARPNLRLLAETMVERILFAQQNGNVIATGSLNSPQLLELSGIGRADLLQTHCIPVIIDNPAVGENLQHHAITSINFEVADDQVSGDIMRDPNVVQALIKLYEETHGGPLADMPLSMAYLPLVDGTGAVPKDQIETLLSKYLDNDNTPASLQAQYSHIRKMLLQSDGPSSHYLVLPAQLHMNPGKTTLADVLVKSLPENYIAIMALHNHPFSRGSVHISSGKSEDKPTYDPNLLSHPLDLEIMARQLQFVGRIAETTPFSTLLKAGKRMPENTTDLSDLDHVKNIVMDRLYTCFHPAGSCAMLPREIGGVVDSELKVYGTKNSRVVDASVFPLEPSGNIQATVYAVAERAADLINS